ncbi:MAG TPA: glycosyltransferase [Granulicella sp.]|nr:glycosyltransferase [Granulicella sp.]
MKIVFYNHTGQMSGAETMLMLALAGLPHRGFRVSLLCPENGPLRQAALDQGVEVHSAPAILVRFTSNPATFVRYCLSILASLRSLRHAIASQDPDVVHANTVRAGITATLATVGTRLPVVWHNHDMLPHAHPITVAIRLLATASRRVQTVACSRAAADTLQPFGRRHNPVAVVHNVPRADVQTMSEEEKAKKREELGVPESAFVVSSVGQITPRKGQYELIRAFAAARLHIPEAILLVCGAPLFNNDKDEEYLEKLKHQIDILGLQQYVRLLGQRRDAIQIIGASDLYVLSSLREPYALTIIEAMAVGTPVLATDCGGPREIIRDGIDGQIVKPGDDRAMCEAIVRLANDPARRSRYAAVALSLKDRLSQSAYFGAWCEIYGRVVPCHPSFPCGAGQ